MRACVFVLLALTLLLAPPPVFGVASASRQPDPLQSYDWVPRTCPSGHYVNFTQIFTPYGLGYHVDSIGNSLYAYDFMGCANETFNVASDGTLAVWGWFRQYDTFDVSLQPSRRHLLIYVVYADSPMSVAKTVVALTCDDGTDWTFRNITIYGLSPGKAAWIGVGRDDHWQTEWEQTAEWADVHISEDSAGPSWSAASSPAGHSFTFYTLTTPFGLGYHIDSSGYADYSYDFYGYTNEVFTVGRSGVVRVRGWFRQYDFWSGTYMKEVNVFAVSSSDPATYKKWVTVLDYTDGDDWKYKDVMIGGLSPGSQLRIGIGRHDGWTADWELTAEWACIEVLPENFDYPAPGLRWNLNIGFPSNSSAVAGDVDSDGVIEAVVGAFDGSVYCADCLTGALEWSRFMSGSPGAMPALGDIDGDNMLEIVVTTYDGLYCLSGNGALEWPPLLIGNFLSAPTLADLDGDALEETLAASLQGHVSCINGAGILEWDYYIGAQILYSSPICADFDGDNSIEVVVGSLGQTIYCLNSSGVLEWTCPVLGEILYNGAASDIDNDGKPEVVVSTLSGWVHCIKGNGSVVWSFKAGAEINSRPVVGDINYDDVQEILVEVGPGFCKLLCLTYPGGLRWTCPIGGFAGANTAIWSNPSESRSELVLNSGAFLYCLTSGGVMKWGLQVAQYICFPPLVTDIDQDVVKEIILFGDATLRCYDYASLPSTRLWVGVNDPMGVPINGVYFVCVSSPDGQPLFNGSTSVDGDGHISFPSILSGSYTFVFSCPGYDDATLTVYLGSDTTERLFAVLSLSSGGGGDGNFHPETSAIMALFSVVLVVLVLGGTLYVARRSSRHGSRSRQTYSWGQPNVARPATSPAKEKSITPLRPPLRCPNCGASIEYRAAGYCQSCGAIIGMVSRAAPYPKRKAKKIIPGVCTVCGLVLRGTDDALKCPHCGGLAHRIHMLEWLHVKDYCPTCGGHLEEEDLQSPW